MSPQPTGTPPTTAKAIFDSNEKPDGLRNCHGCIHLYPSAAKSPTLPDRANCAKFGMERGIISADHNPIAWTWSCKEVSPSVRKARSQNR